MLNNAGGRQNEAAEKSDIQGCLQGNRLEERLKMKGGKDECDWGEVSQRKEGDVSQKGILHNGLGRVSPKQGVGGQQRLP